ncbi:MAG: hypothetical protein VW577_06390 [Pelagibacteraceae bacterium]
MTKLEALSLAMALAITAPTDALSEECTEYAEAIASDCILDGSLTIDDINRAKTNALLMADEWIAEERMH